MSEAQKADEAAVNPPAPAPPRPWRRILSLVLLGSAVALVVVQMTNAMQHDVGLKLSFPKGWEEQMQCLELSVLEEGELVRHVLFRFDQEHPASSPVIHQMPLSRGLYRLDIRIQREDQITPNRFVRSLEISGDGEVGVLLP